MDGVWGPLWILSSSDESYIIQGVFFPGPPPKKLKYEKPRLGEVRSISDNLDTPNLSFPYFNFLGGGPVKKNTLYFMVQS